MNRRSAITKGVLLGSLGISFLSIFKWYKLTHTPDLSLLEENKELIAELAECIIPKTDSPGAKEIGVHNFIIKAIVQCSGIKDQRNFVEGLSDLQNYTQSHFDKTFIQCNASEKRHVLKYFEENSKSMHVILKKVKRKVLGDTFFTLLRHYTVVGYCTSMQGATQALRYDYNPSTYNPCIDISTNQRAWATK